MGCANMCVRAYVWVWGSAKGLWPVTFHKQYVMQLLCFVRSVVFPEGTSQVLFVLRAGLEH
eukprot:1158512-Amphidinium_carterae.1